jgi:hypothetical protein
MTWWDWLNTTVGAAVLLTVILGLFVVSRDLRKMRARTQAMIQDMWSRRQRRVVELLGYEPTPEDWTALETFEREAQPMTVGTRVKTFMRRHPPPMWMLMVLLSLALTAALAVVLSTAELSRRVTEAERVEQLTLQRQQLEAMQGLANEVRRLREVLEGR